MSDPPGPPDGDLLAPGLWTGDHCAGCPARPLCGAHGTADACGHPGQYPPGVILPTQFGPDILDDLRFPQVDWPVLPHLPPAVAVLDRLVPDALVGIRSRTATRPSTWDDPPPDADGHAVLLAHDDHLERLWNGSHRLARALADWDVSLVIAPGFSTWWDDPPSESLVSMARSARFARILAGHLPTVPCVVWRHRADLERWAGWVTSTGCRAVAVDFQTHDDDATWQWGLDRVALLGDLLGHPPPRLVVNGPSTIPRIRDVADSWPGPVTILSQHPWQKAIHGQLLDADLNADDAPEFHTDELITMNVRTFEDSVATALEPGRTPGSATARGA